MGAVCYPRFLSSSSGLALPLVAWEGGSAYWSQFAKASAQGWADPTFFPIAEFLVNPATTGQAAGLAALGINVAMAADFDGTTPISNITDHMFAIIQPDNPHTSPAEVGWDPPISDPKVVGWFACDEPDLGAAGFIGTDNDAGHLAVLVDQAATIRGFNDGRFVFCNFSNGVLHTFWAFDNFAQFVDEVDACSVDQYTYTRPLIRTNFSNSAEWTAEGGTEANAGSSAAYGWIARRMIKSSALGGFMTTPRIPYWMFVETKMPLLDETGSGVILYAQMEGAIWSAIANEARGISYFQQNGNYPGGLPTNDPNTGAAHCSNFYSINDCEQGLRDAISTINSRVKALAPVLNTQSYVWSFGASNMDTMLKAYQGFAYVFASIGVAGATGNKTFTVPPHVLANGTAAVVDESRTVNISGGQFTDNFANDYSHHTYKIALV